MDMRIFHVLDLIHMYNEVVETPNFDGGVNGLFKYKRANAGDQANNEGMFLPLDSCEAE